jgi:hypothetical protein
MWGSILLRYSKRALSEEFGNEVRECLRNRNGLVHIKGCKNRHQIMRYISKDLAYVAKKEQALPSTCDAGEGSCGEVEGGAVSSPLDNSTYLEKGGYGGRCWGIVNRESMPWAELFEAVMQEGPWQFAVNRVCRKLWKGRNGWGGFKLSFTIWTCSAKELFVYADSLCG